MSIPRKKTSRRKFIKTTVAGSLVLQSCSKDKENDTGDTEIIGEDRSEEPLKWVPSEPLDEDAFPYGIQSGDVYKNSAIVSVHSSVSNASLILMEAQSTTWVEVQNIENISFEDGLYQSSLENLKPDTAYNICAFSDGIRSTVSRFRTAPASSSMRKIVFGSTSCMSSNRPWPSLSHAATQDYDFFCFLGDTVYADGSVTYDDYWYHWNRALRQQGMRDITSSTSIIATWDDHEVDNNWNYDEISSAQFLAALSSFRNALPQRTGTDGSIWRKCTWGQTAEVFVLDCRSERRNGKYISAEQMQWLKDGLLASKAQWKIILNSVPITNMEDLLGPAISEDRWQGFPEDRSDILTYIEEEQIPNILWVSGDFHYGMVAKVSRMGDSGFEMYEVLTGPTGSGPSPLGELLVPTDQYIYGHSTWCYTRFTVDPADQSVFVEFIGDDGNVFSDFLIS
jgi:alkaline phosphatase D